MPRHAKPYLLRYRADTGYWYFKTPNMRNYQSTGIQGQGTKAEAEATA